MKNIIAYILFFSICVSYGQLSEDFSSATCGGNAAFNNGCVPNWIATGATPSIANFNTDPSAWMWSYNSGGEAIATDFNFEQGQTYSVSFRVLADDRNSNDPNVANNATINLVATDSAGSVTGFPDGQIIFREVMGPYLNAWSEVTLSFTPNENYSQLWIFPFMSNDSDDVSQAEMNIDDIEIDFISSDCQTCNSFYSNMLVENILNSLNENECANYSLEIPLLYPGYSVTVDWGNGSTVTTSDSETITNSYESNSEYLLGVTVSFQSQGVIEACNYNEQLLSVDCITPPCCTPIVEGNIVCRGGRLGGRGLVSIFFDDCAVSNIDRIDWSLSNPDYVFLDGPLTGLNSGTLYQPNFSPGNIGSSQCSEDIWVTVRATVYYNNGCESETIATTMVPVEFPDLMDDFTRVYPNPTNTGIINISFGKEVKKGNIRVFNLYGEKISQVNFIATDKASLDISEKDSGLYVVKIYADGKETTHKILKQ